MSHVLSTPLEEGIRVQTNAAWSDRSAHGRIRIVGKDRLDLLHRLSTNDILSLKPGSSRWTLFLTDKGRVVDAVRVLAFPDQCILITSEGSADRVAAWISKYTFAEESECASLAESTHMISIFGNSAIDTAEKVFGQILSSQYVGTIERQGVQITIACDDDPRGRRVDVIFPVGHIDAVRSFLSRAEIAMMSPEAYSVYRIAQGIPAAGSELTLDHTPYDLGLRDMVSFTKGCYIGQEVIARLDTYAKVRKELACCVWECDAELPSGPSAIIRNGSSVGHLTSSTRLDARRAIGLAVVDSDLVKENSPDVILQTHVPLSLSLLRLPLSLSSQRTDQSH